MTAAVVVALLAAVKEREGPPAKPLPGGPLRTLAAADGITFGTAVDATALQRERGYREDLAGQFSAVTPENAMKWAVLEPSRGDVHWGDADRVVRFAAAHDQRVRGHTLVWYTQLPDWLAALSPPALRAALRDHVTRVLRRYRGRVADWDVVNEAVSDGGGLRPSLWLRRLGPSYVADAFRWAHAADPHARLWINEIAAEAIGPKSDRLYELVRSLRRRGVPIDGVGFQAHLSEEGLPPSFVANLKRFAALGVKVAVTELDVALELPATPEKLREQARIYAQVVRACLAVDACTGVTVWGFTDRHSWISATQPGRGAATLLDDDLAPKPAYDAVVGALRESPR